MLTLLVASAVATVVATAAPAAAHGSGLRSNDQARVLEIDPPTPGLEVGVRATGLVTVRSSESGEVVILGYEGEPYLRLAGEEVFENQRSPSTYLNRTLNGTDAPPLEAKAAAEPVWVEVAQDGEARWHDHRLHRMDPTSRGQRLTWEIVLLVDGRPVTVRGELAPLTGPARWPWWALGALTLGLAAAGWQRFARRRRVVLAAMLVVAALAAQVVAVGVGGGLAWGAVLVALVALAVSVRADAAWSAGMAGLLVAVVGASEAGDLGYAALFVAVPDPLYRGAVVVCIAAGAALALAAFDITRRGGLARSR
jgi:hypothetical protein